MLDFKQLSKPRNAVVPVHGKSFVLDHKQYRIDAEDGWWFVEIRDNHATAMTWGNIEPNVTGVTYGDRLLFSSQEVVKRKWNLPLIVPLLFNKCQTFEAVSVNVWEDGKAYYVSPNYRDILTAELQDLWRNEQEIGKKKGVTPELRSAFLYHALETSQLKAMQEEVKKKEDHERMLKDVKYRLMVTLQRSGATYIGHIASGNRIVVDWKIPGSEHEYNSVLDATTWKIQELGYCASGDDRRHNLTSAVKLAEDYEQRGLTYITRR